MGPEVLVLDVAQIVGVEITQIGCPFEAVLGVDVLGEEEFARGRHLVGQKRRSRVQVDQIHTRCARGFHDIGLEIHQPGRGQRGARVYGNVQVAHRVSGPARFGAEEVGE